jgi:hypothetical protein
VGCSQFGDFISIDCQGSLVAGCELVGADPLSTAQPTEAPTKEPAKGLKQRFFFWN